MAKYTDDQNTAIAEWVDSFNGEEIPYDVAETWMNDVLNVMEGVETPFAMRSFATKLRFSNYNIGRKTQVATVKAFSPEDEAVISEMTSDPDNLPYLEEIAEKLDKKPQQVRGKLVSMRISGILKRDKVVQEPTVKLFSEEDEVTIFGMTEDEDNMPFIEEIADALGKTVKQVRGKIASLRIKGVLTRDKKETIKVKVYTDEVIANVTQFVKDGLGLDAIVEKTGLNKIGLRSQLGKLGLLKKKVKIKFWDEARIASLEALMAEGKTKEEIALVFETNILVVAKKLKEYVVTEEV